MWLQVWERYKGRITGTAAGFFLGMIYLICGFWDMLIFAFILFICYLLGRRADEHREWPSLQGVWQWLTERWSMFR